MIKVYTREWNGILFFFLKHIWVVFNYDAHYRSHVPVFKGPGCSAIFELLRSFTALR